MTPSDPLGIPASSSTVEVSIVDTSFRLTNLPPGVFIGPDTKGFDSYNCLAFAFLITHQDQKTGKTTKLLFDLGAPKDWKNETPGAQRLVDMGGILEVPENVDEVLVRHGVALESIDALVWSHAHFDHIGSPYRWPSSTELIVGQGVKTKLGPGYPGNPEAVFTSRNFANRKVTELDFDSSKLVIGDFRAIDYFGDGSLYFLDAPGHAIGHTIALARTTAAGSGGVDDTFILMTADSYHHGSQIRPNDGAHLPETVTLSHNSSPCACHLFDPFHSGSKSRATPLPDQYKDHVAKYQSDVTSTPFLTISQQPDGTSIAADLDEARATIRKLQAFDATDNVLLISAHDQSLEGVVDLLPAKANAWKEKDWKETARWRFLEDFKATPGEV